MVIKELITWAAGRLETVAGDIMSAQKEAEWLFEEIVEKSPYVINPQPDLKLDPLKLQKFKDAVEQRATTHKPLAYIMGWVPFCNVPITVRPPVLIPRNETEEWVDSLLNIIPHDTPLRILDLCTGSGCIAIALATHRQKATVIGVDINKDALALAQENAQHCGGNQAHIIYSDLFSALEGQTFDMIVSNPPYITDGEWECLTSDVKEWESPQALRGGEHGLDIYKRIISQAASFLAPRTEANAQLPELVLEHGFMQSESLSKMLDDHGFTTQVLKKDLYGNDRVIYASRKKNA